MLYILCRLRMFYINDVDKNLQKIDIQKYKIHVIILFFSIIVNIVYMIDLTIPLSELNAEIISREIKL